jgi:arabinofuranan 3-O-arabinosyltransferase
MLPATVCGPPRIEVPAQPTRVVLAPAPAFRGVRVVMQSRKVPQADVQPAPTTDDSPVKRVLTVPPGSDPVIAAVRENQNEGWEGSVPGPGTATRVTVDGWQQGWLLKGPVKRLDLSYAPDRLYRIALGVGGILLLLLATAALVGRRRRHSTHPPSGSRFIHPLLMVPAGLLGLGVMAGWWALAVSGVAMVVAAVVRRWSDPDVVSWASGLLVAAASVFYWLHPLGSADGWAGTLNAPQLLVAAALGVLLSVDLVGRGMPRFLRRIAGRSTSR